MTGVIVDVVGLLVVRRRRLLPGALVTEVERGRGWDVDALDIGRAGSGLGLGLGRRLGVCDERHGLTRVVKQLAQDVVHLELGEELDELGQHGGVLEDDVDRGFRQAEVAGVALGELDGVAREAAREEGRVPAERLELVERALGRGPEGTGSLRT